MAVAASILIVAGVATWVLLQKHSEPLVALTAVLDMTAVLDLTNRSVARGAVSNPTEPPLEVNRSVTRWNIYLPLGSSEGHPEVQSVSPLGELLFASKCSAKLVDHVTSFKIDVSLSSSPVGRYNLEIREHCLG